MNSSSQRSWRVHGLWVGPRLGRMEWASLKSFVMHGADFHLFTDDMTRSVPSGVILHDARELIGPVPPTYGPMSGREGSLAFAADIARLKCLYLNGGWWVDMDVICLKSFSSIDDGVQMGWQDAPDGTPDAREANVAVIRLPRKAAIARLLIRRARFPWLGSPWEPAMERLRNSWRLRHTVFNPGDVPWGWSAGPHALTSAVRYLGLETHVRPPSCFYPVPYFEWRRLLEMSPSDVEAMAKNSHALHLWAEMFRGAGMTTDAAMQQCAWANKYLDDFPG